MARRARNTDFFQIRAQDAAQDHKTMMGDPIIRDLYITTLAALRRKLRDGNGVSFLLRGEESENVEIEGATDAAAFWVPFRLLLDAIRDRAPRVARMWGSNLDLRFKGWLCRACGVELPAPFNDLMERPDRFSPDNPILRLVENIYYIPERRTSASSGLRNIAIPASEN